MARHPLIDAGLRPSRRAGSIGGAVLAALLVVIVAGSGGCGILISGDVPAFECVSGPAVCPGDEICDPSSHQCVAPCSRTGCSSGLVCDPDANVCVVADSGSDESTSPEAEAGSDGDASMVSEEAAPPQETSMVDSGCRALLCPCSGNASCDSGVCANSADMPKTFNNGNSFCTQPCCSSSDCGDGTVCLAAGSATGTSMNSTVGNYCVDPALLSRVTTLGTAIGGAACQTGRDCRSGLCGSNGFCADTCCSTGQSSTECSGSLCRFGTFPGASSFDNGYTSWCGSGGSSPNGATCTRPSDCQSELCTSGGGNFSTCNDACLNTPDCGGQGMSCTYVSVTSSGSGATTEVVAACVTGAGTKAEGSTCTSDGECESQFCDASGVCTDVCFTDAGCTKSGWHCRPEQVQLPTGGSYTVLLCGS